MPLRETIQQAQTQAMKERNAERTSVLRMLWSAIRNEEINTRQDLTDEQVQSVIARQVKQLEDAQKDFQSGSRADLAEQNQREVAIMRAYLPAQLTDEELDSAVRAVLGAMDAGQTVDFGRIMGAVMKEVKGKADGNRVRDAVGRVTKQS